MNNIAKVFIIINFVLSILFLGFAITLLSQKWDYKQMYLEQAHKYEKEKSQLEKRLKDAQARIANFNTFLTQVRKTAEEYKEKYNQVIEENKNLQNINMDLSKKLADIRSDIKEINNKLQEKENRIAKLEEERDKQKEIAEEALKAKEEAQDEQQRMEIQLNNLQGELAEKEKLLQRAQKELWEAKQIIRAVQESGVNIPSLFKRYKPLDGEIVAVSKDVPLVMISLGSDDGVEKGYQFTVFRGSKYIGRIVIEEVYKDMSAGRILKNMTIRAIKKGDKVTTRIGGG